MDAPYSRRALLATGIAAGASATAGCIGGIASSDDSTDERTVVGLVISNRLDQPIEVSVLLRLSGELEFWKTIELTTSEPGWDHTVDGRWETAPGDLEVWTRYRPVEAVEDGPSRRFREYTLADDSEDCIALVLSFTDHGGILVFPVSSPDDVSKPCPPVGEW